MSAAGRMSLRNVVKRYGTFTALRGITLDIEPGEFFALLGPSGSGKTTTLRILAGLETVDEGTVMLDDADVTHSEPGERDVAMVFQSYALYPHMTVHDNIAFPLRMIGMKKADIGTAVHAAATKVHIDHLLDRRPGQLSGGQQQRCALARAIVRQPRLFLLDEPLSNLDAKLRLETRVELKKLQRSLGVTTAYVTHDQEEAMTIADRLAVFMDGNIVQIGTPEAVFTRPNSMEVATFLGNPPMNLLPGVLCGRALRVGQHAVALARDYGSTERPVMLGVRPGAFRIDGAGIPAQVDLTEQLGDSVIADLRVADTLIRVRLPERTRLAEGTQVRVTFDAEDAHLFDPETHARL
jgi:ABC-type sugar transport system ATPase subunit